MAKVIITNRVEEEVNKIFKKESTKLEKVMLILDYIKWCDGIIETIPANANKYLCGCIFP